MAKQSTPKRKYLDPSVLQRIGSLELAAREVVEGLRVGQHKSRLRGLSTEFAQHRQYVPGDSVRTIDWRVYAKTERYYVKLYESETNFTANLLLDASRSMHYGSGSVSKLEYAKFMAASLAYLIVEQGDSVGLAVFDDELRDYVEPKGSKTIVRDIAEHLEDVHPEPRTDIASLLSQFAQRISRRGFVMLFSDLFDEMDDLVKGLNHLRFKGHNVTVFHMLDPFELEFPFGGNCKFVGMELDGVISTQPKRIRVAYLDEVRKFLRQIKVACERNQIDYVLVDTSRPIEVVLSNYLISTTRTAGRGV